MPMIIRANAEVFKKTGCKTVICSCPECVYVFKELYPSISVNLKVEVEHSSQFFNRLIAENKIKPKNPDDNVYVYHDPCLLARKLGVISEPREVLSSIPKLEVKEHKSTRERLGAVEEETYLK